MLFRLGLKNVEMSIKNLAALCPKKKMTLMELHFSVQFFCSRRCTQLLMNFKSYHAKLQQEIKTLFKSNRCC